jgi:UDP-2,3-diacylglucosamine pyrophosphatase LpxH
MTTYNETVARRLDEVYAASSAQEERELADMRMILLSDLHKGQRDGADDFQQCEKAYLAALVYYWQQGFELLLLGDVEELWENWPEPVLRAYEAVLTQEREFAAAAQPARYQRFVGNHDDLWYDARQVEQHLAPWLAGQPVIEALRILVHDQGEPLGELFLVHGHQGTLDSDRFGRLSALVVRYVWRPLQRLLNIKTSTPSNDFKLRQLHETAMYTYAAGRPGLVLVAGHTHHPVWEGLSLVQAVQEQQRRGVQPPIDPAWLEEQRRGAVTLAGETPCYFNTGCCSYADRSITGIEIADGEIRLVRWEVFAQPVRTAMFKASLRSVLAAVTP